MYFRILGAKKILHIPFKHNHKKAVYIYKHDSLFAYKIRYHPQCCNLSYFTILNSLEVSAQISSVFEHMH